MEKHTLAEMIRWAVAAGTSAVMEEGTGVSSLARMRELFPQIALVRLVET
jgi:fructose-1-phosphate kinase PfkB-like protein